MLNFGILGAGDIAHAMATTISQMKSVNMYAIASRSMEKAESIKNSTEWKRHTAVMRNWRRMKRWMSSILQHLILFIMSRHGCV